MTKSQTAEYIKSNPSYRRENVLITSETLKNINENYRSVERSVETKQNVPRIDKKTIIPSITYFDENYDIGEEIIKLFNESKEQFFEDGIETQFSKELTEFILKYGNKAVDILSGLFEYGKVSPESIDESLRCDPPARPGPPWPPRHRAWPRQAARPRRRAPHRGCARVPRP